MFLFNSHTKEVINLTYEMFIKMTGTFRLEPERSLQS